MTVIKFAKAKKKILAGRCFRNDQLIFQASMLFLSQCGTRIEGVVWTTCSNCTIYPAALKRERKRKREREREREREIEGSRACHILVILSGMKLLRPPSFANLPKFLAKQGNAAQLLRQRCRDQLHTTPTAEHAPGFLQANLVVVPRRHALDFLIFCLRNPKPCPLLEVVDYGRESRLAPGSDIASDLPKYRVWKHGRVVEECYDVKHVWSDDMVSFLLGCSFTFEASLRKAQLLKARNANVAMYRTARQNKRSGVFGGNLVVSMRSFLPEAIPQVVSITSEHELSHGEPIAIGSKGQYELGIKSLEVPDYGALAEILPDQDTRIPVFWACGVTPQSALECAGSDLDGVIITHSPGSMFVTDCYLEI